MAVVEYERRGPVALITLNRPRVLNASNLEMKRSLRSIVEAAAAEDGVAALILTGAGRAFCVGGDTKEAAGFSDEEYREAIRLHHLACSAIRDVAKPMIAAINGYALGGGLELAMMCDIRIAAVSAQLGSPVIRVGSVATGGLYHQLIRSIGATKTAQLSLTAEPISAAEAERIGLIGQVTEDDALLALADDLARKIAAHSRVSVALAKRAMRRATDIDFAAALELDEAFAIESRRKTSP